MQTVADAIKLVQTILSLKGYALVEKRLFLPEAWFDEAHAERRVHCRVPSELSFQSKPELAAQMEVAGDVMRRRRTLLHKLAQ